MRASSRAMLVILLATAVLGVSCSSNSNTTTSQAVSTTPVATSTAPTTTATTTVPTTTPATTAVATTPASSAASTYQALAALGAPIFSASCAVCHGATGQGVTAPALWGANATLGSYSGITLFANNAQAMLTWISANMPFTSPGSLSAGSQYTDLLAYILTQGNKVSPTTVYDPSQLGNITVN